MNDADVLFPWEREGGERDANAPDAAGLPVDPDPPGAEQRADDSDPAATPDAAEMQSAAEPVADAADVQAPDAAPGAEQVDEPTGAQAAGEPATAGTHPAAAEPTVGDAASASALPSAPGADAAAEDDDDARFAVLDTDYARKAAERASAALREKPIAQKEYYAISEVCELVGLKPHVLRYWETQFQVLNPSKNRSGNRVYQRKEIRLIMLVKHLLYEEKYTVEGAKAKLDRLRRGGELVETAGAVLDRAMLEQLRTDLSELTTLLTPPARS